MALEIVQLRAGQSDNFSYLVCCPETRQAMAIDPSFTPELLLREAAERGVEIVLLANTHGHRDHIAGNADILAATRARLAAHPTDVPQAGLHLGEGMELAVGNGTVQVMHTPGHTPGSLVFRIGDAVITGDTLFVSRCGRADLPGSDVRALYRSLQRLKTLPAETHVYPGHDYGPTPTSTLAWELAHNAYLKCPDLESFIALRMT
jgi:hydroxyacylglutathione hydrolase